MTRTILLADDSVTIQKVIELTFMEEDYEVVTASDGDEALERLDDTRPDVVIADVHMPGASGVDVCRRSKELHPGVPVLLLVGTFEPFDEGAARAAGADAHLKKPFDSQELLQLVGDLMGAAEEAGEPAAEAPPPSREEPGGEPDREDAWGFGGGRAAAEAEAPAEDAEDTGYRLAEETEGPGAEELDWDGPLEPLPGEEEPPAAAQLEQPWAAEGYDEPAGPPREEPFDLDPIEPTGEGEVFDLGRGRGAAVEDQPGGEVETGWGTDRWGFAVEEPEAGAGDEAAAAAADSGWSEVEEPPAAAGFRWQEPAGDEPDDLPDDVAPEAGLGEPAPAWDEPDEVEPAGEWSAAEAVPGSGAAYGGASVRAPEEPEAGEPEELEEAEAEAAAPEEAEAAAAGAGAGAAEVGPSAGLSDRDVERIARRVAELLGERVTREVAWEVVPDLAEVVIRERLRELEGQID